MTEHELKEKAELLIRNPPRKIECRHDSPYGDVWNNTCYKCLLDHILALIKEAGWIPPEEANQRGEK